MISHWEENTRGNVNVMPRHNKANSMPLAKETRRTKSKDNTLGNAMKWQTSNKKEKMKYGSCENKNYTKKICRHFLDTS